MLKCQRSQALFLLRLVKFFQPHAYLRSPSRRHILGITFLVKTSPFFNQANGKDTFAIA
jgi:hypothetical protein